jgi:two-component system response regulator NreC
VKTRILVVDDHAILRAGLSALINGQPDLVVVGEAADGAGAVLEAKKTAPDVVLLDLTMAGQGGLETIPRLRQACPAARVLVLTMHDEVAYLRSALACGAAGYLVKTAADTELLTALRTVAGGRRFVDVSFDPLLAMDAALEGPGTRVGSLGLLTEREREVLGLLASGYTNREAAERLRLSVKSIESYRSRLMQKLDVRTRAELVRFALDAGLLTAGPARPM